MLRWLGTWACLCAVGLGGCEESESPTEWTVSSPDDRLVVTVELGPAVDAGSGAATLSYTLHRDGEEVLAPSPLGIETDRQVFLEELEVVAQTRREVQETYTSSVGKRRERLVAANELTLRVRNQEGDELELILRVHDDGMAYRYRLLGEGEVVVQSEASGFALSPDGTGFMAPYDVGGVFFFGTYEQLPEMVEVGAPTTSTGWAYPALFETPNAWVLITEADLDETYCGTRLAPEPEGGLYRVMFPVRQEGANVGDVEPTSELPLTTPWRVVMAGELSTVVESTLVDDLSRPSSEQDWSWVRPGRAAWSWFTQDTGDEALQREYVDFASELGWEYVLIDARWDEWPDVESVMPALVDDAAEAEVALLLWYNSGGAHTANQASPRDRMLDPAVRGAEMDRLAEWGVAGIKVDFFESDKQDRIQQYIGILEDAASRRLLVNFHGATLPRGWQRTYPHLMTHEAVRGAEYFRVHSGVPRPGAEYPARIQRLPTFTHKSLQNPTLCEICRTI